MSTKQNSKAATQNQLPPNVDEDDVVTLMNQGNELASIASALEQDTYVGCCSLPDSYREVADKANELRKEAIESLRQAAILLKQAGPEYLRKKTSKPLTLLCAIYDYECALALSKFDPETLGHCTERMGGAHANRSESASVLLNRVLRKLYNEYDRAEKNAL